MMVHFILSCGSIDLKILTIIYSMGKAGIDGDGLISLDIDPFPAEDAIIAEISRENSIVEKNDPVSEDKDREPAQTYKHDEENDENNNLGAKMGLSFKNVGGLDDQLDDIVRRVLASR